ncbi:MAG: type I-B CRISPR-associated endonuclease Cas1b [Chitinophagales bacterium]
MKKSYYLFNAGRMSRKDNTLKFVAVDKDGVEQRAKFIPIEGTGQLYVFGALDVNSALLSFLGKAGVMVHFFDYYEHYKGSFMPKEYLLAGRMVVAQTSHFLDGGKRMRVARSFIEGGAHNMLKNLRYYAGRGRDLVNEVGLVEAFREDIGGAVDVPSLMGTEGNIRQAYYQGFDEILTDWVMGGRSKRPPKNEVNALISFGNMMCYSTCLDAIYHTQLNPTIGFLHEPGYRRYSLALDIAEVFKPILVDRVIFKVLNKRIIQRKDFERDLNYVLLKDGARRKFIEAYEDRLKETIVHGSLGKAVSYRHLIKLECYKLAKHLLGMEEYVPLKMGW